MSTATDTLLLEPLSLTRASACYQPVARKCRLRHATFDILPSDVEGFLEELWSFQAAFHDCFARSEPRAHFFDYMVRPISPLERKSIEPMALHIEGGTVRGRSGSSVMSPGMRSRCAGTTINSWPTRWARPRWGVDVR